MREYLALIRSAEADISKYRAELAAESDPERRAELEYWLIQRQQDAHDWKDMIESLRSGTTVHTRGPWEEYAAVVAIRTAEQRAEKFRMAKELQAYGARMLAILNREDPAAATAAHRRILAAMSSAILEEGGMDRAAETLLAVRGEVGVRLQDQRIEDQEAGYAGVIRAERSVAALETLKAGVDNLLMVGSFFTPMGPGMALMATYGMASDSVELGPLAAAKKNSLNILLIGAAAGAPKGWQYLQSKFGNPRLMKGAANFADDFADAAVFAREKGFAEGMSEALKSHHAALRAARAKGADPQTIAKLEATFADTVSAANSTTLTKRMLKAELANAIDEADDAARAYLRYVDKGIEGNARKAAVLRMRDANRRLEDIRDFQQAFDRQIHHMYDQVDSQVIAALNGSHGYNLRPEWVQEFRNATSRGTIDCDRDWGMRPFCEFLLRKLQKGADGKFIPGSGKRADMDEFMKTAQRVYEEAYKRVNKGRSPKLADQHVTTSRHAESFPSMLWLQKELVCLADRRTCAAAGATIRNKVASAMASSEPYLVNLQNACGSLSKDLKTKVLARLETDPGGLTKLQAQAVREHYGQMAKVMDDFAKFRIPPEKALEEMRRLSGGKNVSQIAGDVAKLMEKMGGGRRSQSR